MKEQKIMFVRTNLKSVQTGNIFLNIGNKNI